VYASHYIYRQFITGRMELRTIEVPRREQSGNSRNKLPIYTNGLRGTFEPQAENAITHVESGAASRNIAKNTDTRTHIERADR
jgi:hypothetical protein